MEKEVEEMLLWSDPFAPPLDRTAAFMAAMDLTVGEEDVVVTMDLPGLTPEDLSIEVEDTYLTVRGERKRPPVPERATYLRAERPVGAFERWIQVPKGVEPDRITASMERGVLSLMVPTPAKAKPTTIPIASGTERRQLETAAA